MFSINGRRWRQLGPALLLAAMIFCLSTGAPQLAAQSEQMPMTGIAVPGMESFDRLMINIMQRYGLPGGSLAVAKDSRLVYARGFGLADKEQNQFVQPESLFRIASVSKPITAVTILKLVEEGRLSLDAKVFCKPGGGCLLEQIQPPPGGSVVDPRLYAITVRHLLTHSGGWDQNGVDWHSNEVNWAAARAFGVQPPANSQQVIGYMMQFPLNFTPGTHYSYANIGYNILGQVIEKATGQNYEEYVKSQVLALAGITRMQGGKTRLEERAEGEVRYYDYPGAPLVSSVFPPHDLVPAPYGGRYLEAPISSGGWIASAIDLLRFVTAVDGRRPPALLKPETVRLMISRPDIPDWRGASSWDAMGWVVRPEGGDANWRKDGGFAGTVAFLYRTYHGLAWAVIFNSAPRDTSTIYNQVRDALWSASNAMTAWPTHDLFGQYP